MFLPNGHNPSTSTQWVATTSGHHHKDDKTGGWSSLIGVVTAICGNILISFALNTQRYAHIRLSRAREAQQEKSGTASGTNSGSNGQGMQKTATGNERADLNVKAEVPVPFEEQEQGTERDPLLPKADRRHTTDAIGEDGTDDVEDDDASKEKSYLKSPIWWVGIALMTVGETGNFLAYGFAPASIVSPLGVVALISNCVIAPVFLGERFRWRDALGVVIAVGGCVVVVLSANSSDPKLSPDAIWDLVTAWEFETYLGITISLIIVLMVLSNKYGHRSILIDLGVVGLFGGYTALSTKGVASLLTYSIWRVVTFPITYLLVAVLVGTAVMQIKYINRALQRFNSTMVIPTQFVIFTLSVIIGSAVLYRDFERENTEDAVKFVGGCALTFFGVWCITSGRSEESDEDESQPGDEEDAIDLVDDERVEPEVREINDIRTRQSSFAAGSSYATASMHRHHSADPASLAMASGTPTFAVLGSSLSSEPYTEPLMQQIAHLPPADASAIHVKTIAPMSPERSKGSPSKKPPIHATTSEPVVPTTPSASASLRPKTPLTKIPSTPAGDSPLMRTPSHRAAQYLSPNDSPRLFKRQSTAGLIPGPFTSPLSGSLSAIVADELRRGTERSPMGSMNRRKTSTRQANLVQRGTGQRTSSKAAVGGAMKRQSVSHSTEAGSEAAGAAAAVVADDSPPAGRARSLSATLSDMFGSGTGSAKRQRTLGAQEQRRQQSLANAADLPDD